MESQQVLGTVAMVTIRITHVKNVLLIFYCRSNRMVKWVVSNCTNQSIETTSCVGISIRSTTNFIATPYPLLFLSFLCSRSRLCHHRCRSFSINTKELSKHLKTKNKLHPLLIPPSEDIMMNEKKRKGKDQQEDNKNQNQNCNPSNWCLMCMAPNVSI